MIYPQHFGLHLSDFFPSFQPENQNRSYVIQSTASFSVIEMPYKNLEMELPSNSTTVRHTNTNDQHAWKTQNYLQTQSQRKMCVHIYGGFMNEIRSKLVTLKLWFSSEVQRISQKDKQAYKTSQCRKSDS